MSYIYYGKNPSESDGVNDGVNHAKGVKIIGWGKTPCKSYPTLRVSIVRIEVRTVVLGFFCLIVYTRRQKSVIITEIRILTRKPLYYQAKVDTIRQNPYTNTETACEFPCSYKGFRDCISSFRVYI